VNVHQEEEVSVHQQGLHIGSLLRYGYNQHKGLSIPDPRVDSPSTHSKLCKIQYWSGYHTKGLDIVHKTMSQELYKVPSHNEHALKSLQLRDKKATAGDHLIKKSKTNYISEFQKR